MCISLLIKGYGETLFQVCGNSLWVYIVCVRNSWKHQLKKVYNINEIRWENDAIDVLTTKFVNSTRACCWVRVISGLGFTCDLALKKNRSSTLTGSNCCISLGGASGEIRNGKKW